MVMSDAELRRRKKLQGHISQTTATLGLTALGARGAASKPFGRMARLSGQTSEKLKNASTGLTTLGAGVGGAGGYNFAAYTNAEAKRKQPVQKGMGMLDFGLSGVTQGENIVSKAMTPEERAERRKAAGIQRERKAQKRSERDAAVIGAGLSYATAAPKAASAGHQVGNFVGRKVAGRKLVQQGNTKPFSAKRVPRQHQYQALKTLERSEHIGRNVAGVGAVAAGAAAGYGLARSMRKHRTYGKDKTPVFPESIKKSMESKPTVDERVNDAGGVPQQPFKTTYQRPTGKSKSTSLVTPTGAKHINTRSSSVYKAGSPKVKSTAATYITNDEHGNNKSYLHHDTVAAQYRGKSLILRRPKYQATSYSSHGAKDAEKILNSGKGSAYVHIRPSRYKKEDRKNIHAAYQGNKKKVSVNGGEYKFEIHKAYDPEAQRQKRLERYSTGAAAVGGAAAAGSAHYGAAAYRSVKGHQIPKYIKMAGKNAGRSAALGAAATGGVVAAHKIRTHAKGRGQSYKPLRSASY